MALAVSPATTCSLGLALTRGIHAQVSGQTTLPRAGTAVRAQAPTTYPTTTGRSAFHAGPRVQTAPSATPTGSRIPTILERVSHHWAPARLLGLTGLAQPTGLAARAEAPTTYPTTTAADAFPAVSRARAPSATPTGSRIPSILGRVYRQLQCALSQTVSATAMAPARRAIPV